MTIKISSGVVHEVPKDVRIEITASEKLVEKWNSLTLLARNEWICWITSVKKQETRNNHIKRMSEDLLKGKRRSCC